MAEEVKTNVTEEVQEAAAPVSAAVNANSFDDIVARISKQEGVLAYKTLKVRNVIVNLDNEDAARITLVVDRDIRGNIVDAEGNYKVGTTKNVFVSAFAVAAVLKENENTAMLANYVVRNPKVAENILSGAIINVLQQPIKSGEEYKNPFSTRNSDDVAPYVREWDWFANYITSIKLGIMGNKVIDKLIDRIVDEML